MADKLGIRSDVRKLRLGDSFKRNAQTSFNSIRYDFKPASVDTSKVATVDIGQGNQVTVTVPHIEGSGTAHTVFKGSKKPATKECVLIIDPNTGDIVLERLSNSLQLKKTRAEGSSKIQPRPNTPVDHNAFLKPSPAEKNCPNQRNTTSPNQHTSPFQPSPAQRSSPPYVQPTTSPTMSALSTTSHSGSNKSVGQLLANKDPVGVHLGYEPIEPMDSAPAVGVLSDSSSDSSSSGSSSSGSESESEAEQEPQKTLPKAQINGAEPSTSNHFSSLPSMPQFSQLSEDLRLSDSDSD